MFYSTRLGREMLLAGRGGVKHRPFHLSLSNGGRIMGRIPQRDGKGVKGSHPLILELDEASDYPDAGWIELIETLTRGVEGARWRAHGVTRGVRDWFYKVTQPDSGWTVHRYTAYHRPNWSEEERKEKIKLYGSKDAPDFRRNILGLHGDATSPLFVLARLMAATSTEDSEHTTVEYYKKMINAESLADSGVPITEMIDPPSIHLDREKYIKYWAGMDIGLTNHPSEIIVFGETKPSKNELSKLKALTRLSLYRISAPDQARVILHLIGKYKLTAFALDKTGMGEPIFQLCQELVANDPELRSMVGVMQGFGFSEKIIVGFDMEKYDPQLMTLDDVAMKRNVKETATDDLRGLVDAKRLQLAWDVDLIGQFQGQTASYAKASMDLYGKRNFSLGSFHALDACRMMALAWSQAELGAWLEVNKPPPPEMVPIFFG
jgi:hypothetical protein